MKRYVSILALLVVIVAVVFAIGACQQKQDFAARSVPVVPGAPGDFVSKNEGGTFDDAVNIVVPTANATADTGFYVNNLSVAQPFQIADAGTDLMEGYNGGGVAIAAPTAIGTAVPALVVDSAGLSNLMEVRDNVTPVFAVENGGDVSGKVLRYATASQEIVCGTQTITDTADISSTLESVTAAWCSLNANLAADSMACSVADSSGTLTVKVRNSLQTPAANSAGVLVGWCAVGTPY